jgi:hypothetical protein
MPELATGSYITSAGIAGFVVAVAYVRVVIRLALTAIGTCIAVASSKTLTRKTHVVAAPDQVFRVFIS